MNQTLLIELLTEELPPKALEKLAASFAQTIGDELKKMQFAPADAEATVYASPRRLAVQLADVAALQPDQKIARKGPAVTAGFKDGQPTPALAGFARSCGVEVSALSTMSDGKQDVYAYESVKQGQPLAAVLADVVALALKKLPAPKLMRWGSLDVQFVRPVHGLIMLHGDAVVPGEVLGLQSGQSTRGHRFLSEGEVTVANADAYARTLHESGKVVASFDARRELIRHKLTEAAARLNATIAAPEALFDEVTGLVEWPVVLEAGFEAEFLRVPQECLILTMQQNQKYFPLLDASGKLMNRFLLVSNLETADPSFIVGGNERVLRARLSDAKFFFEQDQKARLDSRLPRLANVVYHNKIGSQLERVERLQSIAGAIAHELGADAALAARAAYLAKADLVSDMVGEFPELQGVMGMYYAQHDGEHAEVAAAIEGHYHPRFAGDTLPEGKIATAVALADKLETIVGIWGIGLIPTGDKDPFALRRAALGVVRMALEADLDVKALLNIVAAAFPAGKLSANVADEVFGFMMDRLKNFLAADYKGDEIDAVLAQAPSRLAEVRAVLSAVAAFKALPEASALAAANKRVKNILKKAEGEVGAVNPALLSEAAEQALFAAVEQLAPQVDGQFAARDFAAALTQLASLRAPVDAFFDGVMVMADDAAVRNNRIALLARLAGLFNRVADISLLAE
ncbi:glycine--tRNA ligase subunit beta [Chromobacterium haemolyticum]|uniref:Glycine--tRNA ligase beta subunit n=1 Tax=Chromobacterium haemolyticum TaxID=394935 RepID=A0ABS3GLE4_9NEIS|nr:glycine--tRNA ligase subunit beta [Chromobacterium haemolyticum]MBK0414500.1 glycine--tRNA ligase subunit beta [Chromobacterium haemolyticum]MBO0415866.1 glycine--tRNA ligase subunit beta [Chromobacterium haemolyticum]MBO0499126.1 glycine--tRNA ligase subunit beta [Chromobacterium haemolyticum]MDH0342793.1 glycine--tRNA ligase subunit beta [Chromobacterium haemolyticum]OQS34946.1 glycine--tRNA ligase subunit beta [Chromobacterium haemolyticum]